MTRRTGVRAVTPAAYLPVSRSARMGSCFLLRLGLASILLFLAACDGADESKAEKPSFTVLHTSAPKNEEADSMALPEPVLWETPIEDPLLEQGRRVWRGTCIECHSTGLGGAPLIGNRELWDFRIQKGFEVLEQHAIEGFYGEDGEMPARGGNDELTDEEVRAAVRFMTSRVENSI